MRFERPRALVRAELPVVQGVHELSDDIKQIRAALVVLDNLIRAHNAESPDKLLTLRTHNSEREPHLVVEPFKKDVGSRVRLDVSIKGGVLRIERDSSLSPVGVETVALDKSTQRDNRAVTERFLDEHLHMMVSEL